MSEQGDWEKEKEERMYRARRERFALAIFRVLAAHVEPSKLVDWIQLAKQSVEAADALEEELNPTSDGPLLPDYVP